MCIYMCVCVYTRETKIEPTATKNKANLKPKIWSCHARTIPCISNMPRRRGVSCFKCQRSSHAPTNQCFIHASGFLCIDTISYYIYSFWNFDHSILWTYHTISYYIIYTISYYIYIILYSNWGSIFLREPSSLRPPSGPSPGRTPRALPPACSMMKDIGAPS